MKEESGYVIKVCMVDGNESYIHPSETWGRGRFAGWSCLKKLRSDWEGRLRNRGLPVGMDYTDIADATIVKLTMIEEEIPL